jgi:ketosteroid isomerase-like protein
MKLRMTYLLLFVSLLSSPIYLHSQNSNKPDPPIDTQLDQLRTLSRDELDIIKVLTAQERAWNRGDIDAFLSGYKDSPDLIFIGRQVSHGFAQLQTDYKHNYPNKDAMGALSFSELEPHLLSDRFAVVLGHYRVDRNKKAGGPADGIFSLVFEKTDKGWKIIVDHTT